MSLILLKELEEIKAKKAKVEADSVEWLIGALDDYTHAVTLTSPKQYKDEIDADMDIKEFVKRINKKFFRRKKTDAERLKIVIVFEELNGRAKQIHAHCAIRKPIKLTYKEFEIVVKETWRKVVRDNQVHIDVQPYVNSGWLSYAVKQFTSTKTNGISQYCNF